MADNSTPLGGMPNNTEDKLRNQVLSGILLALQTIAAAFPRITGTFTLAAAATKTVAEPRITANSVVSVFPINAAAATLMSGAKSLYWDPAANVAGASFTVKTADGTNAAGTEQFSYVVINPV